MKLTTLFCTIFFTGVYAMTSFGQNTSDTATRSAAPAATVLPMPGMSGPLTLNPTPTRLNSIYISGVASGLAQFQTHAAQSDKPAQPDLSNGMIFIQKSSGLFQFYLQVGTYSVPDIGVAYIRSSVAPNTSYGVVPLGYVKIAPSDNFSVMIGKLSAFLGAEYTFSFQNMNIQRGLLWDQSNSVNRGVQLNYSVGPLAFAVSYNDGFYSDKYNWLAGSLTYTVDAANTLTFIGAGSLSRTDISSSATPLYQDNEHGYNIIYTHTAGQFTIQPYLQYTGVPKAALLNTRQNASAYGAAVLVDYSVPHSGFSLPVRAEYITSTGSAAAGAPGLIYGPGSKAWSATVTPTYQYKRVFVRAEVSYVKAGNITRGSAFGPYGNDDSQSRAIVETGIIF